MLGCRDVDPRVVREMIDSWLIARTCRGAEGKGKLNIEPQTSNIGVKENPQLGDSARESFFTPASDEFSDGVLVWRREKILGAGWKIRNPGSHFCGGSGLRCISTEMIFLTVDRQLGRGGRARPVRVVRAMGWQCGTVADGGFAFMADGGFV